MTKPNASQAAIKLARSKKLDLGEVKPANQKTGQITKGDVEAFIKAKDEESAKKATDGAEDQPAAGDDAAEGPDNVGSQSSGDGATPEAEEKAKALAAEKAEEAKAESKGKKGKAAKREIVKFRDAATGEIEILVNETSVVFNDQALVAKVLRAKIGRAHV